VHDFSKPWSNDFDHLELAHWRDLVERGRPGLADALRSEVEPALFIEPLASSDFAPMAPRPVAKSRGWITAQQYDLRDPGEIARCVREDADFGLRSAWVRVDLGQRAGAKPRGLTRPGVTIATEEDAAVLLEATEREGIALWIEAGACGRSVTDRVIGAAARLGLETAALRGGVLCDPLGTLAEAGCLHLDLATALAELASVSTWAEKNAPAWSTVELSAVAVHDAGATAAQELAFVVATGLVYLRALEQAGLDPARALPRFVLRFAVGSEAFLEIAKLRAARWLWERVAAQCGVASAPVRLSARTAWRNRTRFDPWVNLLRGTVESFAAIVGGADEVATQPLTEAIGAGDSAARRWAIHTQNLLREESHVGRVRDAAGGSHAIEDLTRALTEQAWELVRRIEATGGMAEALLLGEIDGWVAEAAEARRQALATGETALVGTTLHPNLSEARIGAEPVASSEPAPADARLEAPPLHLERLAEPYEALRENALRVRTRTGHDPRVGLVVLEAAKGKEALGRARAVLCLGGFEPHEVSVSAMRDEIQRLGARVAVLCGVDDAVEREASALVQALGRAGATHVLATSTAATLTDALREAGVFAIIGPKVDVPTLLTELQRAVGVVS
jgi:methylmalonyl-CoA mutase